MSNYRSAPLNSRMRPPMFCAKLFFKLLLQVYRRCVLPVLCQSLDPDVRIRLIPCGFTAGSTLCCVNGPTACWDLRHIPEAVAAGVFFYGGGSKQPPSGRPVAPTYHGTYPIGCRQADSYGRWAVAKLWAPMSGLRAPTSGVLQAPMSSRQWPGCGLLWAGCRLL